jgi:hypothetical protein
VALPLSSLIPLWEKVDIAERDGRKRGLPDPNITRPTAPSPAAHFVSATLSHKGRGQKEASNRPNENDTRERYSLPDVGRLIPRKVNFHV